MIKIIHLFKDYYLGISIIGIMAFLIQEIPYIFSMTILMILINFIGWIFYYLGYQYGWLIVLSQFAVVPLYYLFFGLWKGNYLLVGAASMFFIIHTINGYLNFVVK